ncbi:MAG: LytTR family DNA-binding domain-containing protein [Anaerovoracaceae bacterium]|jgi:DNA-binding LytR/AlgR family response regulator
MRVDLKISPEYEETYAVIYCDRMTSEVSRAMELLGAAEGERIISAERGEKTVILRPQDVYMVRIENGDTIVYTRSSNYRSRSRLYEITSRLGSGFMKISKSAVINLSYLDSIEARFGGMMHITMKNGSQDYVSRKYLPELKKYLGLS